VGQALIDWKATDWLRVTGGKMPNPLFTSSMVWDPDLNPEGLTVRGNYKVNPDLSFFGVFGEWVYQDYSTPSSTTYGLGLGKQNLFLQAFELGGEFKFTPKSAMKVALNYYNYTGGHKDSGFAKPSFKGEPTTVAAGNFNNSADQIGVNDLSVFEIPLEVKFPLMGTAAVAFGNYAKNTDAEDRARIAGKSAYSNQDYAFQIGFALGSEDKPIGLRQGLTLGGNAKKGWWEARTFYQEVRQYALDPNLVDSDFFEGRTNLKGFYVAAAYSPIDDLITTLRFGTAKRLNTNLGTAGFNGDLPLINPITNFKIIQFDVTLNF
jgi:hypothetical protein